MSEVPATPAFSGSPLGLEDLEPFRRSVKPRFDPEPTALNAIVLAMCRCYAGKGSAIPHEAKVIGVQCFATVPQSTRRLVKQVSAEGADKGSELLMIGGKLVDDSACRGGRNSW